jgi:predicted GNAT family acetyltransferase
MGPYFGIRDHGRLVAMCGERMNIRDLREGEFHEISGLCTHPEFRGRGYAPALLVYLLLHHRAAGLRSYLHVASDNATAIALYQRLGFRPRGEFPLYSLRHSA